MHPIDKVFDYKEMRLLVGILVVGESTLLTVISQRNDLPSLSYAYHTSARDFFVGMSCVIAAFLWSYRGHSTLQAVLSRIAGISAFLVAICPTKLIGSSPSWVSRTHDISAFVLFSIMAIFCLCFFREDVKGKTGKKKTQDRVYRACGYVMVACMAGIFIFSCPALSEYKAMWRTTFWFETLALYAFGIAWFMAAKLEWFVDEDDSDFIRVPRILNPASKN